MSNLVKFGFLALLAFSSACSNSGSDHQEVSDQAHRPADWSSEIEISLLADTILDDASRNRVLRSAASQSYEQLIEQVWQMAFSGDVDVYAPDVFGEFSTENKLDPRQLHDLLKKEEQFYVEDLNTGEMRDTVMDVSFTKQSTSAINLLLSASEKEGELEFQPYALGVGKQVFDEATGTYRGVSNKFFMAFGEKHSGNGVVDQRFLIESDSTGVFRPTCFESYTDGEASLQRLLEKCGYSESDSYKLRFRIECGFRDKSMKIEVLPIGREA